MAKVELLEVAIHVVFEQPEKGRAIADYAEALTPIEPESSGFIQNKLEEALEESAEIVRMAEPPSPVPGLLDQYMRADSELLTFSGMLAKQLQDVQTRNTPDGLLLVAKARYRARECVLVAKMEHEVGARAEAGRNSKGQRVYSIKMVNDLFVTAKTRVFKVGLFYFDFPSTSRGRLTDTQAQGQQDAAAYFMHRFLGCEYARRPEVVTRDFYQVVSKTLKSLPAADRTKCFVALVNELNSNAKVIDTKAFARAHLDEDVRSRFRELLNSEGIPSRFTKNTALIESNLKAVELRYNNGAVLYTLPDQVSQSVVIESDVTTINASVEGLAGSGKKLRKTDRFLPSESGNSD